MKMIFVQIFEEVREQAMQGTEDDCNSFGAKNSLNSLLLDWPKGSFGFFRTMALVALSCL